MHQVADERTRLSILTSALVSIAGFFATRRLIPLTKAYTLKAGLWGLDINKKGSREGEKKVPESLGLAAGVVFLVSAVDGGVGSPMAGGAAVDMCSKAACRRGRARGGEGSTRCLLASHPSSLPTRPTPARSQICIVLFQQLHYYDIPSLVRSLRAGEWAHALGGSREMEVASDAWWVVGWVGGGAVAFGVGPVAFGRVCVRRWGKARRRSGMVRGRGRTPALDARPCTLCPRPQAGGLQRCAGHNLLHAVPR